ncbi:MAG: hypothetical protein ACYS7M_04005 [Planctomycetota bacterium]|jgi:hypothetical protein
MTQVADAPARSIQQKVLDHIQCSHAAIEKAAQAMAAQEQQKQTIAAIIPEAVKAAVSGERIDDTPEQREKLAEICKDHEQLLQLFCKVAIHRNAAENTLGSPVDATTKTAGTGNGSQPYDSLTDPRVGVRSTRVKQSSVAFFRKLGLDAPSEGL